MKFPPILSIRWLFTLSLAFASSPALAQQDTADRLWQGAEQQLQQFRQQSNPAANSAQHGSAYESALQALTQSPRSQLEQLTFSILSAVNNHDWFGADRLLRQYAKIPHHDPALFEFVTASRLASDGDYQTAIESYKKVLQSNPGFIRGELDMAQVMYADNRLRDAQRTFDHLQSQPLPAEIQQYINEYQTALKNSRKPQISLTLALAREDNVNSASTVIDPCAIRFLDIGCQPNDPGKKIGDTGFYFEGSLNKLWSLSGNHGILLRSLNYGNHFWHNDLYDNLVSTNYLGYQYSSARNQFQLLPLFEYDREGRQTAYRAPGVRVSFRRQLNQRAQLEASYEYKARNFTTNFDALEGDLRTAGLFGSYALSPDLIIYANLLWRDSDAKNKVFAYQERITRIGFYKSFSDQVTLNVAYSYRKKWAEEAYVVYRGLQRDHENSLYLNVTVPRWEWEGFIPTLSYEYRNNVSTVPHVNNYEKNRITLGFNKNF